MKQLLWLCLLLPLLLGGGENLLKEWESPPLGKNPLKEWRFQHWGNGEESRKYRASYKTQEQNGALELTLETAPRSPKDSRPRQVSCRMIRSVTLPQGGKRRWKFQLTCVSQEKQLIFLELRGNGAGEYERRFFNTSSEPQEHSVEITTSGKSPKATVSMALQGSGKVTFSRAALTEIPGEPEKNQLHLMPERRCYTAGEYLPALVNFLLQTPPEGKKLALKVRLPRGYKLVSGSWNVTMTQALPEKDGNSLYYADLRKGSRKFQLLIGSLREGGPEKLPGSVELLADGQSAASQNFLLKTGKEIQACPVPGVRIGVKLPGRGEIADAGSAILQGLSAGGIRHLAGAYGSFCYAPELAKNFTAAPALYFREPSGRCKYALLREKGFVKKQFHPAVSRYLRKNMIRPAELFLPGDLGQGNGIRCLCVLCRSDFADYAPTLPRQQLMNLPVWKLQQLFPRELAAFRAERHRVLWEAVAADRGGLEKKCAIWPEFYILGEAPAPAVSGRMSRIALRFPGTCNSSAFLCGKEFLKKCRASSKPKAGIIPLQKQSTGFLLPLLAFSGCSPILLAPEETCDLEDWNAAFGALKQLEKYREFFRRGRDVSKRFKVDNMPMIQAELLPDLSGYPLPERSICPAVRHFARQNGKKITVILFNLDSQKEHTVTVSGAGKKFRCTLSPVSWKSTEITAP